MGFYFQCCAWHTSISLCISALFALFGFYFFFSPIKHFGTWHGWKELGYKSLQRSFKYLLPNLFWCTSVYTIHYNLICVKYLCTLSYHWKACLNLIAKATDYFRTYSSFVIDVRTLPMAPSRAFYGNTMFWLFSLFRPFSGFPTLTFSVSCATIFFKKHAIKFCTAFY